MPIDFEIIRAVIEKANKAVDWIVEEIIRQKNWRSLLVIIDVTLFLALNPDQAPFPNLLKLFPQLRSFDWYEHAFWSLIIIIFISAVIAAALTPRKPDNGTEELKPSPIKGLLPFGHDEVLVQT